MNVARTPSHRAKLSFIGVPIVKGGTASLTELRTELRNTLPGVQCRFSAVRSYHRCIVYHCNFESDHWSTACLLKKLHSLTPDIDSFSSLSPIIAGSETTRIARRKCECKCASNFGQSLITSVPHLPSRVHTSLPHLPATPSCDTFLRHLPTCSRPGETTADEHQCRPPPQPRSLKGVLSLAPLARLTTPCRQRLRP